MASSSSSSSSSFALEDVILINRLRDQEAILSSKSEEIKKILSSIPESKYITIPSTAIKTNSRYKSNTSRYKSNTANINDIPSTPYSYIDRISVNTNSYSSIKTARNTNSYSKSNISYNPNMIDILTIKQRLDDNNDYDTLQQEEEYKINSYMKRIKNKRAKEFIYKLYEKMFRRKYADRHYYKYYGKFFLGILHHAINDRSSTKKKRITKKVKADNHYYNKVMTTSIKKWYCNTSRRNKTFMKRSDNMRRSVLLIKARYVIDKLRRTTSRKKKVLLPASKRNRASISISKKSILPTISSLPPPSAFADLFHDISNPSNLSPSSKTRLLTTSISPSNPQMPPSPPQSPGSPLLVSNNSLFVRLLSPSPSLIDLGNALSQSSLGKDASCQLADLHFRHRQYHDYLIIWKAYITKSKTNSNADCYVYWSKRTLINVIKIWKSKGSRINRSNNGFRKTSWNGTSIVIRDDNKRRHLLHWKYYTKTAIHSKKVMTTAINTNSHKLLSSLLLSLSSYTNFRMQLRRKVKGSIKRVIALLWRRALLRWISSTETVSISMKQCDKSSKYYIRKLVIKCIKRWIKKAKTGSTSKRLMKINSYVKGNTKSKNKSRRINTLGVARRRVFLRRWYYYANSHTEKRLYMKKVNKFFVQNAQRSLLQRLLQRTSYATSIRISVKNYRKYKHALLVTSQYIQKFTKYVTSNKKKRASSISKISDMKYYYYSLALSSLRHYMHQKRTIANTIVMTKTNTNKMRKFMLFWKKRIRRHHRSLTKITKALVKRRRLLCPKYLSHWISYLSLKIIKHREYSKLIKKVILTKGWESFHSNIQRKLKNSKRSSTSISRGISYINTKSTRVGFNRLSNYYKDKHSNSDNKYKSSALYRKLLLRRVIVMWKDCHYHATEYLREACKVCIKFKYSKLLKRLSKKVIKRRLLVASKKFYQRKQGKKYLRLFLRWFDENAVPYRNDMKYSTRYHSKLILSNCVDLWFRYVQLRRKEKMFESTNSHKHHSIINISSKNIRKYGYRRALTSLYNNATNSQINTINYKKADSNAYLLLVQYLFDKLHDYWSDNGYRNYEYYDDYCCKRMLKIGIRQWAFAAKIRTKSRPLSARVRPLLLSCIKLKKQNDSNLKKIIKANKLKKGSSKNNAMEGQLRLMYLADAAAIGPAILELVPGELASTNDKRKVSGQVYLLQLALTYNYWRVVKSLMQLWTDYHRYRVYLVDRLDLHDSNKLKKSISSFTKWVNRRKDYRKTYHRRADRGHKTCQLRATLKFWRKLTRFTIGTRTLKLKRKALWFKDCWLVKYNTRMRIKGVIEHFLNDELRQEIYFLEWCKETLVENKLFKYLGNKRLRQLAEALCLLGSNRVKSLTLKKIVRRHRGMKASRYMKHFFDSTLSRMGNNIKNEKLEATATNHFIFYLKRNVLYNLLFFRRNRIAHDYVVKKKSLQFINLLKVNATCSLYDKSVMKVGNIALMRKMFERLVSHTLYGSNTNNIHKTKKLNGKKYSYKTEMMSIVDEWKEERSLRKFFQILRKNHSHNVKDTKLMTNCDYHHYRYSMGLLFKKLIKQVSKTRKNTNKLKHIESVVLFKLVKNALQKLDYNACLSFANNEKCRLVDMHYYNNLIRRGLHQFSLVE